MNASCCAIIPTYDNSGTIEKVVQDVRAHIAHVIVVDDGSSTPTRKLLESLCASGQIDLVRHPYNRGKGASVQTGLERAKARGFSHALQIDADGQHNTADIPKLLAHAQKNPRALILAAPQFDATAPKARLLGRKITLFWTHIETFGRVIEDPMCGFRIYPVDAALQLKVRGQRMDFDPEIAVRFFWAGHSIINVPSKVRYISKADGGISHFRLVRDNFLISVMHTRLFFDALSWRGKKGWRKIQKAEKKPSWLQVEERGSIWGIQFFVWLTKTLGPNISAKILAVVMAYYFVFAHTARRASREYLLAVGQPATARSIYRHLLSFGQCTLDRIHFVCGDQATFQITRTGQPHLHEAKTTGRGSILLGAHLGSFEAGRTLAEEEGLTINIVGHFSNAQRINAVLRQLQPHNALRVLDMGTDAVDMSLRVRECIERGEFVAIMADRATGGTRDAVVSFFGRPARFPTGPFILAHALKCPVLLTFGLYLGDRRYALYCEPFADPIVLPRQDRQKALTDLVQAYAQRLEHYCKLAPYSWFNFFPIWTAHQPDVHPTSAESLTSDHV